MWSDRLAAETRKNLVSRLRRVLPAPRADARPGSSAVESDAPVVDVARALWPRPGFVWLDGAGHKLFADPIARISVRDGIGHVRGFDGEFTARAGGFDLLEAVFEAWGGVAGGMLCGYLGYELASELEGLAVPDRDAADLPDLHLGLYDRWLEYGPSGWRRCGTSAWRSGDEPFPSLRAVREARSITTGRVTASDGFEAAVARLVRRIFAGEVFQVNLCRRLETRLAAALIWPLYLRLREASPASHGALIRTGRGSAVLSVSPELFLGGRGPLVRSCPIKGTRVRGGTPEEDTRLAAELLASEKDRAELAMIVDVVRNDLARVCRPGSVRVARHAELMPLPTVHHTFSEVTGTLREDCGTAGLLRACFPPASITGAPKIRAMELAALEEGRRRGPSMGAIGWLGLDGGLELSVAIRTAVASAGRVWYLAGCGITAESDPAEELRESEAKAAAFLRALGGAGAFR
jgi:para-aminobenzoate synthetase component 1